jgi:hypothetical protein
MIAVFNSSLKRHPFVTNPHLRKHTSCITIRKALAFNTSENEFSNLSFHERSEQKKRAKEVSEHSEWNGRKFTQKKILARPYKGRGMSSVHLSVCPSVHFGHPRTLGLGPRASRGSIFQTYLLPGF